MQNLSFPLRLMLGSIRAMLISGGAYWRIALLPVLVPAVRGIPWVAAMLTDLGLGDAPDWVFYMIALGGAVLILAIRVAWLEISRIKVCGLNIEDLDGVFYLRIVLKNESFKGVDGNRISVISSEPTLSFMENPTLLPLILSTQQRLQRQRQGIEPVPQGRFFGNYILAIATGLPIFHKGPRRNQCQRYI